MIRALEMSATCAHPPECNPMISSIVYSVWSAVKAQTPSHSPSPASVAIWPPSRPLSTCPQAITIAMAATAPRRFEGELPPVLRDRPIAVRAFDEAGMLVGAELALADDVEAAIGRLFANPEAAYLHAHNAAHGCFAARIDRG